MSEPRTAEQWMVLGDDLPTELAKVFTPKEECKHDWVDLILRMPGLCNLKYKCTRCTLHVANKTEFGCVPDPIKTDWNTAKEYQNKCNDNEFLKNLRQVYRESVSDRTTKDVLLVGWIMFDAQPRHYLIADAMALERR